MRPTKEFCFPVVFFERRRSYLGCCAILQYLIEMQSKTPLHLSRHRESDAYPGMLCIRVGCVFGVNPSDNDATANATADTTTATAAVSATTAAQ